LYTCFPVVRADADSDALGDWDSLGLAVGLAVWVGLEADGLAGVVESPPVVVLDEQPASNRAPAASAAASPGMWRAGFAAPPSAAPGVVDPDGIDLDKISLVTGQA
jgi:hypothetical protein